MYTVGEGDDKINVFEVGDAVRVNNQDHPMCGFYGWVRVVDGLNAESPDEHILQIARTEEHQDKETYVTALNSSVEAN